MKQTAILLSLIILFSSCASILTPKYQKVSINTNRTDRVYINHEKPVIKKGKYLLERNLKPAQITVKSKDQLDRNVVVMQWKRSPWYILSWIPFGIYTLGILPMMDVGPRAYNYNPEIAIPGEQNSISNKVDEMKELMINKVSVDLKSDDVKFREFSNYKSYIKSFDKVKAETLDDDEDLKIENSAFSIALNEILKDKGFIDTTRRALKNSYINNLLLNATVNNYIVNVVNDATLIGKRVQYAPIMASVEIQLKWELLDYYENVIFEETIRSKSGEFAITDPDNINGVLKKMLKDGLEKSMTKFVNSDKVQKSLTDKSNFEDELSFDIITIKSKGNYVASLNQAIQSSVTVMNGDRWGSGFIISEDGYIITNHHVVAGQTELEVITNNGKSYKAELIRQSKIYDLALLKIKELGLLPFQIDSSTELEIGTEIFAIGTPTAEDLAQTVSKGIISGIRNLEGNQKLIQTDASINRGNSGGALVTNDGMVKAVVNSKISGLGIEGVAFGIPANQILQGLKIQLEAID